MFEKSLSYLVTANVFYGDYPIELTVDLMLFQISLLINKVKSTNQANYWHESVFKVHTIKFTIQALYALLIHFMKIVYHLNTIDINVY